MVLEAQPSIPKKKKEEVTAILNWIQDRYKLIQIICSFHLIYFIIVLRDLICMISKNI